jgi:hypothetical protein
MQIDCRGGQTGTFQVRPEADNHGAIEGQSGFAAVPRDEPVNGECVAPTRMNRSKRIQHGRVRQFEFRDSERIEASSPVALGCSRDNNNKLA